MAILREDIVLLILDGHGSHLTPQFDQLCNQNNIVPICMPAHSFHLLQPLDVGCFAVLKRTYGRLVEEKYNTGAVILTFLPYHTTPLFLNLLSILPETLPPAFKVLVAAENQS